MKRLGCLLLMLAMVAALGCGQSSMGDEKAESPEPASAERSAPGQPAAKHAAAESTADDAAPTKTPAPLTPVAAIPPDPASKEQPMDLQNLKDTDLVPISDVIPDAIIDIVFAREDNPFHYRFFKENKAYLRYGAAKKLAEVARDFDRRGLRLKIWSSYRPFPVQVKMFQIVGGNANWVSDPYHDTGKRAHVRAVAVDCTLVDKAGRELEMPTPYLDFAHSADRMKANYMKLPPKVLANRKLLHDVMVAHGMEPYLGEWWHFQDTAWATYPVITMDEFPEIHRELLVGEMLTLR